LIVLGDFESYLAAFKDRLGLGPAEAQEIIDELETHLNDKVKDLEAQGVDGQTARTLAVQHLGDPSDIARRMRLVYGYAGWSDVVLAALPHLMVCGLFLFKFCCNYFVIALALSAIAALTWYDWRKGNPSNWSYSWLGYVIVAPVVSFLIAIHAIGYGAWVLLTGRSLPVFDPMIIVLIACAPFAMYSLLKLAREMVRRDWLLVSFAALPVPVFGSWVLFYHSYEVYMGIHLEMLGAVDYLDMGIFVGLAVITGLYLKLGRRALKVGLLLVSAVTLGVVTAIALPPGFNLPNAAMVFLAYIGLVALPVLWKLAMNRPRSLGRATT